MYILRILKIAVLIAAAVSICSCDKKPTVRETVKEQSTQKVKTKKKKVKKAKTEQTKTADSNEPQWDKRFLSFDIDTENVVSGGAFSGSVDISAPFKNTNIGGPYNKKGKNTIFFPLVHNSATFFV